MCSTENRKGYKSGTRRFCTENGVQFIASVWRIVREETQQRWRGHANNWQARSLTLNIALRNNQPVEGGWSEGNLQRGREREREKEARWKPFRELIGVHAPAGRAGRRFKTGATR